MRHSYFKNYFNSYLPSWDNIIHLVDRNISNPDQIEVFENLGFFIKNADGIDIVKRIEDHLHYFNQHRCYPETHVYVSYLSSSKTVGYHRDRADVYIVQTHGSTQYKINEKGEESTYVLTPGDMLFIPAHVWHEPTPLSPRACLSVGFEAPGLYD